ncbi:MAG TPA: TetR/AcrR family transcriptional regulator [Pseudonocardia sp.]|jgi:AcrR family transcriptional regulator
MAQRSAAPDARRGRRPVTGAAGSVAAGNAPSTNRGRRTRAALVAGARQAFEELGFRDARISDIAERAGTSYGVFYHYFDSKESILDELFTSVTGEMYTASQTSSGTQGDPAAKIRAANRQYLVVAARNARLIATIEELAFREPRFRDLKLRIREPWLRRNEAGIRRLQERGLADPGLDAAMAATMLGGMVEHFTMLWFVHGVDYDEDLAVETLTRLWAGAIGLSLGGSSGPPVRGRS